MKGVSEIDEIHESPLLCSENFQLRCFGHERTPQENLTCSFILPQQPEKDRLRSRIGWISYLSDLAWN